MAIKRSSPDKAMKAHGLEWVGAPEDLPELLGKSDYVILCLPAYNVLATPHIGGSTDVSMRGIVMAVAENIRKIENNLKPLHLKK